mmetsp:Transcript_34457/g.74461  ORF Transcript_34457/g.74461 Transcript_34457/m.74461 type:complete len:278 (+) Transcript_34457:919-1752(+)
MQMTRLSQLTWAQHQILSQSSEKRHPRQSRKRIVPVMACGGVCRHPRSLSQPRMEGEGATCGGVCHHRQWHTRRRLVLICLVPRPAAQRLRRFKLDGVLPLGPRLQTARMRQSSSTTCWRPRSLVASLSTSHVAHCPLASYPQFLTCCPNCLPTHLDYLPPCCLPLPTLLTSLSLHTSYASLCLSGAAHSLQRIVREGPESPYAWGDELEVPDVAVIVPKAPGLLTPVSTHHEDQSEKAKRDELVRWLHQLGLGKWKEVLLSADVRDRLPVESHRPR